MILDTITTWGWILTLVAVIVVGTVVPGISPLIWIGLLVPLLVVPVLYCLIFFTTLPPKKELVLISSRNNTGS